MSDPEVYYISPTLYVPNSKLPVLVYRNCLPRPYTSSSTIEFLERHKWKCKGIWGEIKSPHYHATTHEAYGIFSGSSRLLLGRGPFDKENEEGNKEGGLTVTVYAGDVIVNPAGVSHCSLESDGNYKYIGIYPDDSVPWDSNECKSEEQAADKTNIIACVRMPEEDPVFGVNGPMMTLWAK